MTPSEFIDQIINDALPLSPWIPPTFETDFILLSEFSELEGPKPLLTIPPSMVQCDFNLNAFSVRIMSADCVSIIQTESFADFKVAGDIKVILTELKEGAVAYVHHFVLYDICARGYVRPFCIAYITNSYPSLMSNFNKLLRYFSTTCLLIRFGNAINFLSDLLIRLDNLTDLLRIIDKENSCILVEGKPLTRVEKAMINSSSINDVKQQLLDLRNVFLVYINSEQFVEHRKLYATQYETILLRINQFDNEANNENIHKTDDRKNINHDLNMDEISQQFILFDAMENNDSTISSKEFPSDVIASVLGKRHFKPLRQLHELCMPTFPLAFEVLKSSLNIKLKTSNYEKDSTRSSQNFDIMYCGADFPALTVYSQENDTICCSNIPLDGLNLSSMHIESFLTEISLKQQRDKLEETKRQLLCVSNHIKQDNSFLSYLQNTCISSPISVSPDLKLMKSRETREGFVILDDASYAIDERRPSDEGSCDSFKEVFTSPYSASPQSLNSNKNSSPESSIFQRSVSTGNSEDARYTICSINIQKCSQVSLLKLRKKFSFLSHIVYSLFIKRPVVIIAEEKHKARVRKLIYCLVNFLPLHVGYEKRIIPWCQHPLQIQDLRQLSIIGISKSTKSNPVPFCLRTYISLLDYENQTLTAPPYDGMFLKSIFDGNCNFHSEQVYRDFIRQKFAEVLSLAYVQFSAYYMQSGRFNIGGYRSQKVYSSVLRSSSYLTKCDTNIVYELSNCFREFFITNDLYGSHDNTSFIKLNLLKCSLFTNKVKKR